MSFYLEEECKVPFDFAYASLAEEVVNFCIAHENFPYEAEVNLTLTDNKGIHVINKEYRQIDRPTDVLSFPMIEYTAPGDFDFLEQQEECFDPESGELVLGDIVISKEKVIEQAEAYGHSVKREYAFLITHSVLHLTGYDHIEDEERQIMEEKQREILKHLQILR